MKRQSLVHSVVWLIAIGTIIALHGTILYHLTSHIAPSAALMAGLIVVVIVKLVIVKRRRLPQSVRALFHRHKQEWAARKLVWRSRMTRAAQRCDVRSRSSQ